MARKAAYINQRLGGFDNNNLIHADAGGFSNHFSESGKIKTEYLLRIHDLMNVDAVNVTARELANDANKFISAINGRTTKYISSNIVKDDGSYGFAPYKTIRKNGKSICLVGVADIIDNSWDLNDGSELLIADPTKSLKKLIAILRNMDSYILLTDLPSEKIGELLIEVKEIDLVLKYNYSGHSDDC